MGYDGELSVRLFGPTLLFHAGQPVHLGIKGATLELLLYLVVHAGQEIRREQVADLLWRRSSTARQRSALNSALWRIGKKLPDMPGLEIVATDSTVALRIGEEIDCDAAQLECLVRRAFAEPRMTPGDATALAALLEGTDAPFLDGLDADWTLALRERLSSIRARGMIALMHHYGDNHDFEAALEIGRRLLAEDPFRESVQTEVMFLYVMNGQRVNAIRHYEAFRQLLARELGIEPMVETRALFDLILRGLSEESILSRGGNGAGGREWLAGILAQTVQSRRELYLALRVQPS